MLSQSDYSKDSFIRREIEPLPSSARPVLVSTEIGDVFIKGIGNPQGAAALISELVCAELATWFGLKVPPFGVVRNCPIEIQMIDCASLMEPPFFFSKKIEGVPRDGSDRFLRKLSDDVDVARLIVFDTWVLNSDRHTGLSMNSDNLLFSPTSTRQKYDLVPIDHTHCLVEVEFSSGDPSQDDIKNDDVYGFFPEFEPYVTSAAISHCLEHLATLDRDFVTEIVNSVPSQWQLGYGARLSLIDLICWRSEYIIETIGIKLVDDPTFPRMRT